MINFKSIRSGFRRMHKEERDDESQSKSVAIMKDRQQFNDPRHISRPPQGANMRQSKRFIQSQKR